MPSPYINPAFVDFQSILENIIDIPYFTGTVPLNAQQSALFYRCGGELRLVDFANPTEAQLEALADACAPATFGRNQEDVLDESYRKAGKMDSENFAVQFSPWDSGIITTAVDSLFESSGLAANVVAELYKLNVYGPGSFFKAHVDTPRSDKMFGSLVVVFPTPHTGGSLLFRHDGKEYAFDSAKAVATVSHDAPHVAFAAFFSDVEHEVAEVTSGYRVTLTYNLYHSVSGSSDSIKIQNDKEIELSLQNALTSLLSKPDFLQDGGLLAFDLSYEYPFNRSFTRPSDIGARLKGVDALLKRVCDALELDASVKALYRDGFNNAAYCFVDDHFVVFGDGYVEDGLLSYLCKEEQATPGYDARCASPCPGQYGISSSAEILSVVWAKPPGEKNSFKEQYIYYGNDASMSCAYGQVCLVVCVQPAHERG